MKKIDLTGNKFSRLLVLEEVKKINTKRTRYKVKCDCGKIFEVNGSDMKNGNTKSCGCYRNEKMSNVGKVAKHNMSFHPIYKVFHGIRQRCYNSNDCNYHNYGARGISVCDEWRSNFNGFCKWAVDNGWKKGLSIDRIDVNGNYEPSNCRWATSTEQSRNTRKTLKKHQVLTIRNLYKIGAFNQSELAKIYNKDSSIISLIINNKSYYYAANY